MLSVFTHLQTTLCLLCHRYQNLHLLVFVFMSTVIHLFVRNHEFWYVSCSWAVCTCVSVLFLFFFFFSQGGFLGCEGNPQWKKPSTKSRDNHPIYQNFQGMYNLYNCHMWTCSYVYKYNKRMHTTFCASKTLSRSHVHLIEPIKSVYWILSQCHNLN